MTTLAQDARALLAIRTEETEARKKHEDLKEKREIAERELIQRMEGEEVDSLKTGGKLFVKAETIYASVNDRKAFVEWALENDDSLIEYKEASKTDLTQLVNKCIEDKQDLPPGVSYYVKEYVSQRAA